MGLMDGWMDFSCGVPLWWRGVAWGGMDMIEEVSAFFFGGGVLFW